MDKQRLALLQDLGCSWVACPSDQHGQEFYKDITTQSALKRRKKELQEERGSNYKACVINACLHCCRSGPLWT